VNKQERHRKTRPADKNRHLQNLAKNVIIKLTLQITQKSDKQATKHTTN